MNTARQLLWLPTTREEKYKAKQAIDTFFMRGGDVLSAVVVYVGSRMLHLTVEQFAIVNIALTLGWIGVALAILGPRRSSSRLAFRPLATAALALGDGGCRRDRVRPGDARGRAGGAAGREGDAAPSLRARRRWNAASKESAAFSMRRRDPSTRSSAACSPAAVCRSAWSYAGSSATPATTTSTPRWSFRNFKLVAGDGETADVRRPHPGRPERRAGSTRRRLRSIGNGNESSKEQRTNLSYRATTVGVSTRVQATRFLAVGGGFDAIQMETGVPDLHDRTLRTPSYRRSSVFAEYRLAHRHPATRSRGGLYRIELSDYHQTNAGAHSFSRVDAEAQHFVPLRRENSVIAFRALASTTNTAQGQSVPFVLLPGPRRQPHAARLSQLAVPRSQPDAP